MASDGNGRIPLSLPRGIVDEQLRVRSTANSPGVFPRICMKRNVFLSAEYRSTAVLAGLLLLQLYPSEYSYVLAYGTVISIEYRGTAAVAGRAILPLRKPSFRRKYAHR